jgi:hypothetical protein
MSERIPLRAFYVEGADPPMYGIALPDGRLIVGGNQTYSSERALLKYHPAVRLVWVPSADTVINHIEPEDA